ncbi:hypothetical protein NDU88_001514 [Pleurodeles waltl]|uniref:Uncharacterized protein n=1 Tax=Pleurodeles waltl TaxID=8319 RepID=A0AAV7UT10_PLEWA|nr:hypothetical protein NDU88_001514 [Pleurodeles waltl]
MLKRDIAADIKDRKKEVIDLGQREDSVEQTQDAREEELDCHRRELLTLQDKNQGLQYQIEDLENRSRRSNIRIKGIPAQAVAGPLEDFVVRLFRHVGPIATLWETLKVVVRGQIIVIAARQNTVRCDKRQQLEDDIQALEETHRQSLAVRRQLAIQRKQLRALDEGKEEYALLRTKQKFYTGGNRAGRLLAHRLRIQSTEHRTAELRLPKGTLTCPEEPIRQHFE